MQNVNSTLKKEIETCFFYFFKHALMQQIGNASVIALK